MGRDWGTREPNSGLFQCQKPNCPNTFFHKGKGYRKFCDDHLTGQRNTAETKTTICASCHQPFTQERRGIGSGRRRYCAACKEGKLAASEAKMKQVLISKSMSSNSNTAALFEVNIGMIGRSADYDDNPFELFDMIVPNELAEIMRDLEQHEVVYGRSVTECPHQHPFDTRRLDIMISKVNPKKIAEMIEAMRSPGETLQPARRKPLLSHDERSAIARTAATKRWEKARYEKIMARTDLAVWNGFVAPH